MLSIQSTCTYHPFFSYRKTLSPRSNNDIAMPAVDDDSSTAGILKIDVAIRNDGFFPLRGRQRWFFRVKKMS